MGVVFLATLAQARQELDVQLAATGTTSAAINNNYLMQCIAEASSVLNETKNYPFLPILLNRKYDATLERLGTVGGTLQLNYPLVEATSLTIGGVSVPNGEYGLVTAKGGVITPYLIVALTSNATVSSFWPANTTNTPAWWVNAITLTGVWCWHHEWQEAWLSTLDSITNVGGINASVTTFNVTDVDGVDAAFNTPRLSAGNLIQIDDEYMWIMATDTVANTVSVMRGAQNTIATAHAQGASISKFWPDQDIVGAAAKYAAYLYRRRGDDTRVIYDGVATTTYNDRPDFVLSVLAQYPDLLVYNGA